MPYVIEYCLFKELSSTAAGGALSLGSGGEFLIQKCCFYKCSSTVEAPGLFINQAKLNLKELCFSDCSAPQNPPVYYIGIEEYDTIFFHISIDLCKTTSNNNQYGGPFNVYKTNANLTESNITKNNVNHIAAAQNKNSQHYKYKYFNVIGNKTLNGGVVLQFNIAPGTELSFINLISNEINNFALLRAVYNTDKASIPFSNFKSNKGTPITGPISANNCFSDTTFSIENQLDSSIDIASNIIKCEYIRHHAIIYESQGRTINSLVPISMLICYNL